MAIIKKTSITLTKAAERFLNKNDFRNRSAAISKTIERYEAIIADKYNSRLDYFINNIVVQIAITEFGDSHPIPTVPLSKVLEMLVDSNSLKHKDLAGLDDAIYKSKGLSVVHQMVIVERVEAQHRS